jgi:anti-sigma regulatory factor (Ser/Thr protein kinase)
MSGQGDESASERLIARLVLAAERDYLTAALAFLREASATLGLSAADISALARATEEVCLNVIVHGFEPGQPASFDLVLLRRPGQLVLAVEDQGRPFDWSRIEPGSSVASPALTTGTDAVRFMNFGTQGNRVEIVKHLPFDHVETCLGEGLAAGAAATSTETSTASVSVRAMMADDAIGVARCTYAVYGYSVPDEYLYFPDRMREMLQGGLLEVCVGATADGEIVSCLTREVARPGAPVGYLGEGMVDPRFRGHRLLEQMLAFIQRRTEEQGMLGLYGEAVTVHPFSQKSNLALGFTETGIQLADEAPTVVFKQIDIAASRRTATVLMFIKTGHRPARTVFLPLRHRTMIERIYERGRFERTVAPAADAPLSGAAQLAVEIFPKWSEASLRVVAYGADLVDLVRFRLRALRLRHIDWISLDLPLSHPATPHACEQVEALGFFFAGVIPDLVGDDILRLQYLNEVEADLESVHLASDFAKDLFAYVVEAMKAQARP